MGELLNKPYEISVWEDILTQNGFVENKLAVIGSNLMEGLNKVYEPVFTKKSNGEKTLSFSLKYKYFDPYTGNSDIINPFAALLVNERKVKLYYDNQWYEFIVKDHSESSDGLEWTYTCTDAFVLELSKNGYNITFDTELNNNQGTARELAKETLKDTDWQIGSANIGRQVVAEPIYKAQLISTSGIDIINTDDNTVCQFETPVDVYLFYSYVKNKNGKFVQFIIHDENRAYTIDDKNVITDTNFRVTTDLEFKDYFLVDEPSGNPQDQKWYELDSTTYVLTTDTEVVADKSYYYLHPSFWNGQTEIISIGDIETYYQAYRIAYNQLTTYDPVTKRIVDRFKLGENGTQEVYRYQDYTYTTSNVITNFFTNGENFNSLEDGTLQGWNPYVEPAEGASVHKLELVTRPELGTGKSLADISKLSQIEGFLKMELDGGLNSNYQNAVFNSGIENHTSIIKSISQGEEFVLRWRAAMRDPNESDASKSDIDCLVPCQDLRVIVAKYTQDDVVRWGRYYKHIDPSNIILDFQLADSNPVRDYNYVRGGTLELNDGEPQTHNYVIDGVPQVPSTKYVYIVSSNGSEDKEYIWDITAGDFIEYDEDSSDYIPYYYLIAKAQKSVSNLTLTNPVDGKKIGIFVYTPNRGVYYIQDIQLTRYIKDADGKPVIIGNLPKATSKLTDYYYLKPEIDDSIDDILTYNTPEDLIDAIHTQEPLIPLYNKDAEKVLSISESHSNCFNILQSIAETFECWVDLVVEHDEQGYILRDEGGRPRKYVYLKEYVGNDNFSGFKYGINIDTIERTVNSDEIVTKLIVNQSKSEYTDEGYVSIANSPSNSSGESYILNFDYYYNQGLLDRESAEVDKTNFIAALKAKNIELQEKEKRRRDLEASFVVLESKRNVYTELLDTAEDNKNQALADFEELTGESYEDYKNKHISLNDDDQLTEEKTIVDVLGKLYTTSAVINNYSGLLTNIENEYWEVRKALRGTENYKIKIWVERDDLDVRHIYVELSDYLTGFQFTLGEDVYTVTVSQKFFDIESNLIHMTFTPPAGYTMESSTYDIVDRQVAKFKITSDTTIYGVEDEIEDLINEKEELTKSFNNKYSRFIQEGTWDSTDYLSHELYYLDALQVSNTSAQPTVSYSIKVVEISQLEGFECYNFDAGDKSYIEDTEFFGWSNVDGHLTPAREEVIVSEVEWHLDEPDQNVITVQNYKTRFEDLFQRISATVQTVQYNEATYAKISSILDANGTINQNVLLDSLNNISGKEYNLTSDGSVLIQGDEILVRNLTNSANLVKINSEGIRISSDGGTSWATAIDGRGINIGVVYTGKLNTDQVIIGSDENPSFRWDKSGISAYKQQEPTRANPEAPYDLQTFVRFDQYGLYGIKNNGAFKARSLSDVKREAHFAVTWDGFFIKNSYEDGGRVSITSDNDFQVIDGSDQERIKIGSLGVENNERIYGISIKDKNGNTVLSTNNDGDLTMTGTINATGGNFSGNVQVGTSEPHINIDGINALIGTSNYQDGAGYGWMINADGDAVFNNITARGAIKTAVFEYAEIQAVGGVFIFRPSSTIKGARLSGNDLIVRVEKPLLFAKVAFNLSIDTTVDSSKTYYIKSQYGYEEVTNPIGNPVENYYYEKHETSYGSWCKISNYTGDGNEPQANVQNILLTNGLTHVYEVTNINASTGDVTLAGGKTFIDTIKKGSTQEDVTNALAELEGGALIDMGRKDNSSNYGIGVNSSDNTVNLPARAISLFETIIDETKEPKVSYNYRGILGTLPRMDYEGNDAQVNALYHNYMEGTQGIYTDNMYIGDSSHYLAFYTDANSNQKRLKISGADIIFTYDGDTKTGTIDDIIADIDTENSEGLVLTITSNHSPVFNNSSISATLTAHLYQNGNEISYSDIQALHYQINWYKNGIMDIINGENTNIYNVTGTDLVVVTAKLEDTLELGG